MKMLTWREFKPRNGSARASCLVLALATALTVPSVRGGEGRDRRPASLPEIQRLFTLATASKPQRSRFEADIEVTTKPYTEAQVGKALAEVEQVMQAELSRWNGMQKAEWRIAQSNAIVKAHSGKRIQHVREWYSGKFYRLDVNDEGWGVERFMQTHPGEYCQTYVSIPNSPFSEYASYEINRNLRDIMVFKQDRPVQRYELWQALQMHELVSMTFVIPLMDSSDAKERLKAPGSDFSKLKMDPEKAERLSSQTSPNWRLEATDGLLDGKKVIRFSLKGDLATLGQIQSDVWAGEILGKTVCMQESVTNSSQHTATISKRERYYAEGFPQVWKVTTVNADASYETKSVAFKRIETLPTFTDEEAFAPVFPPGYIVSDMSSGKGVILQKPPPEVWIERRAGDSSPPP
jgi:hypothetical protein